VLAAPAAAQEKVLLMATTTSTEDTGLLNVIGPEFKKASGIDLRYLLIPFAVLGITISMVGIVNTLYRLFSFPVEGISQGAQALWGYNLGAGRMDRVRPVTRHALAASTAVCVLCTLLLELYPRDFVSLFTTKDAAFLTLGARGLSIFFLGFFSYGFRVVAAQFFQSVGRPAETIVLLVGRNVLLIAGMILLPRWLALDGVLWAGTVSEVLMAVVSIPFLVGRGSPETVLSAHAGRGSQAADRGGGQAPAGPLLRRGE
jgi:Na+-driven multidrug efflux pump